MSVLWNKHRDGCLELVMLTVLIATLRCKIQLKKMMYVCPFSQRHLILQLRCLTHTHSAMPLRIT